MLYVFLQDDGTTIILDTIDDRISWRDSSTGRDLLVTPAGKLTALRLAVSGILEREINGAHEKIKISSKVNTTSVSTARN